ncbi:MAG: hypothetical protein EHM20_05225 [Alphaproteobacteria bacterium]|nr:MAG: hypothetical protein EHM20_05225 [Alphaproteobacteria bacterium]
MKSFFIIIFILLFGLQGLLASDRVDQIIEQDAMESLQQIWLKKKELREKKAPLQQIYIKLKTMKKGQPVFLQARNVGGTMVIATILIGTYRAHFPLGMRVLLEMYLSNSNHDRRSVRLSNSEIRRMSKDLSISLDQIKVIEKSLENQTRYLCEQDSRHQLCYGIDQQ